MRLTTTGLALVALILTGCSAGPAKETLTVYTAFEDDELAVYRKAFEEAHPDIDLRVVRDSTGVITARLLAEKANPQADVVWGLALTSLLLCDEVGMLDGYNPEGLGRVEPRFRDTRSDPARYVGIKAWMTGIVCNTIELEAKGLPFPASFKDLLKPEYRGCVVMPNPASSGTGFLTVSAILQLFGEEEGWAYLDALHENIARYTHSGSAPAKLAGTGEYPVGISFGYRGIRQKAQGEPVETMFPAEGSGWDIECNALVRKPVIKESARRLLDWAIGDEAMKLYAKVYPVTSVPTGLPVPEGYPADPLAQFIENDFHWAASNRDRILEAWHRRYDSKSDAQ
jgi:iron(III) transport system substrate-binding protein